MKLIVIPGMGCTPVATTNWYSWLSSELSSRPGVDCVLRDFPDPHKCREHIWVPFVELLIAGDPADTFSSATAAAPRARCGCWRRGSD